ncbi:MAG: MFS transporter [Spirochaetota bacterium]|nr:MFS transporter [Spirochaetota bacterium]
MLKLKFHYCWIIVLACFLCCFSYGVFYTFGVFFKHLQLEFGWSRGLTATIHSIHWIFFPISSFIIGRLTDKLGPKPPLLIGAFFIGLGISLLSQVQNITQFYIFYSIASLGSGIIWSLPTAIVQRWFVKLRGLSLGIVASGVGMGYALSPLSSILISDWGWRTSYIILGIGICLILLLAYFLIESSPQQKGLTPYGNPEADEDLIIDNPSDIGWETKAVLKNKHFWQICGIHITHLFAVMTVAVHFVMFATDKGISEVNAATAWFVVGLSSIPGRIAGGFIGEKIGYKNGFIICGLMNTMMLIWFLNVENLWMLYLFAPIYGFFYGAQTPMLPAILGQYYGLKPLGTLIGTMMLTGIIGGTMGPYFSGLIFDKLGSYILAFGSASAFWALCGFLAFILKKPIYYK